MFIFFCVPSSVQQPFATLSTYVFYSTCSFCLCQLYPTPSRNSFAFLFVLLYSLAYAPTTRTVKVQLAPPAVSSSSVDEVQPVSCFWCSCHPAGVTAETTAEDRSHSSRNHSSTPASTASLSIGGGDVVRTARVPLLYPCRHAREKLSVRECDRRCSPRAFCPRRISVGRAHHYRSICIQFAGFEQN